MTQYVDTELDGYKLKKALREDCKWQTIADVDWDDLDFFLDKFKRLKDKDSYDTTLRILAALNQQLKRK